MNLDYYNEDIMDAFLTNALSKEEMAAVQTKLEEDSAYVEALDLHKNMRKALKLKAIQAEMQSISAELDKEGFYEQVPEAELEVTLAEAIKTQKAQESVAEISEELEEEGFYQKTGEEAPAETSGGGTVRSIFNMRYIGIAASILLVVGAFYLLMPTQNADGKALYASYFSPPAEDVREDLEMLLEGTGFAINKEELLDIKEGLKAYVKKDYNKTISVFEPWLAKDSKAFDQNQLRYLLAVSQMAVEDTEAAIKNLKLLEETEGFNKKEGVEWYLALAYLKEKDHGNAKAYLDLVKDSEQYGPAASDLLKAEFIKHSSSVIHGNDRSMKQTKEKKLRFGLKDISKLSVTIHKKTGKVGLLNEGQKMPSNIVVSEVSIDVFDGDAYSGSLMVKGNDPFPMEEMMPDEVLILNMVVLEDKETNETAGWERVPHQWVDDEEVIEEM